MEASEKLSFTCLEHNCEHRTEFERYELHDFSEIYCGRCDGNVVWMPGVGIKQLTESAERDGRLLREWCCWTDTRTEFHNFYRSGDCGDVLEAAEELRREAT